MMIQQASERTFSSVRNAFTTELGGEKICIDEEQQRVQKCAYEMQLLLYSTCQQLLDDRKVMHEAIQSSLEMHKSAISMKKGVEKRVEIFSTLYEAEDSRYVQDLKPLEVRANESLKARLQKARAINDDCTMTVTIVQECGNVLLEIERIIGKKVEEQASLSDTLQEVESYCSKLDNEIKNAQSALTTAKDTKIRAQADQDHLKMRCLATTKQLNDSMKSTERYKASISNQNTANDAFAVVADDVKKHQLIAKKLKDEIITIEGSIIVIERRTNALKHEYQALFENKPTITQKIEAASTEADQLAACVRENETACHENTKLRETARYHEQQRANAKKAFDLEASSWLELGYRAQRRYKVLEGDAQMILKEWESLKAEKAAATHDIVSEHTAHLANMLQEKRKTQTACNEFLVSVRESGEMSAENSEELEAIIAEKTAQKQAHASDLNQKQAELKSVLKTNETISEKCKTFEVNRDHFSDKTRAYHKETEETANEVLALQLEIRKFLRQQRHQYSTFREFKDHAQKKIAAHNVDVETKKTELAQLTASVEEKENVMETTAEVDQVTEQVRPICGHRISVEVKAAAVNARKLTSPCKKKETKRTLQAVHQLDSDDSDDIFSEPKRYSLERSEGADSKTKHRGKESMHLHLEEMFTASMILTEKVAQKPKIGNIATKEKMDATFNGDNSDGRVNATLRTVLRQDQTSPNRQSANKKGKVVPSKIDRVFAKLPMPSESPHYLARIASAPDGQGKGEAPQGRGVLGNAKSANNSQNYDAFDFVLSQDTPLTLQFPKKISKGPNVANRHGSQAVSQNVGGAISRTQDHSKNEQEALKKFFSPKKSVPSQQDHRKDGHIPKRSKIEKVVTIPREKRIDGCNYDDVFNFFANM